ncbi:MAG: thymidine phosphorylase [Planctomycetes bacterium]|jgi:pyrimidine-nucleoside phosphorylase|nr:thymidine phosphorylase [Planctomycetota bacterium]
MFPQDIIIKKRDNKTLTKEEIQYFVQGVVNGDFTDYQSSALLMAIYLNGMSPEETSWLTEAMMKSGDIIQLSEIDKPKVDKHSTGGVGDKVSLILGPLAAACGLCVPMISGRGLGHTGGTLDKLESIPGFKIDLTIDKFRDQLQKIDIALIGQTSNLAPADKKLYALRDVTGTVESIPLICGSILSKKFAEGTDSLVMDVKWGKGAFMKTFAKAKQLAESIVTIGKQLNHPVVALITDMNQPLGKNVGNALEMIEAFDMLKGKIKQGDLYELTIILTAHMLVLGKITENIEQAKELIQTKIDNGEAIKKMQEVIEFQGGNPEIINDYSLFPQAQHTMELKAQQTGYIQDIHALKIGTAVMYLGAGRKSIQDSIDPAVGITDLKKVGDFVHQDDILCKIYYNDQKKLDQALPLLMEAFQIAEAPPSINPIVAEILKK